MTLEALARVIQDADPQGPMLYRHLIRKRYLVIARAVCVALWVTP